jgi:hypothetical protein
MNRGKLLDSTKNAQDGDSNKEFDRLEELIEAWRDKVRATYV